MRNGTEYTDPEDFIFDDSDDDLGQPGGSAAGGGTPPASVPAQTDTHRHDPQHSEPADSAMVSEAIRSLIAPQRPQAPASEPQTQTQQPPAAPAQNGQQPGQQTQPPGHPSVAGQDDLTPRERALLRDLQEERRRRQDAERGGRPQQQPGQQTQQPDLATLLFENPEQVLGSIQQQFASELAGIRLEHDIDRAIGRHGQDKFQEAFQAFMGQVGNPDAPDPRTYERVMASRSPGEEIVRWYRESSVLREVGEDPAAYRERLRAEIMAEMAGGQTPASQSAGQQPPAAQAPVRDPQTGQFAPRHEVRLPTPIGRMAGGVSAGSEPGEDGGDDAIFDAGRAPSKRR